MRVPPWVVAQCCDGRCFDRAARLTRLGPATRPVANLLGQRFATEST